MCASVAIEFLLFRTLRIDKNSMAFQIMFYNNSRIFSGPSGIRNLFNNDPFVYFVQTL